MNAADDIDSAEVPAKWIAGVLFPLVIAALGIAVMFAGEIVIPARGGHAVFRGATVIAWGLVVIAGVIWLHCSQFWARTPLLAPFTVLGLTAAVLLLVASVGFILVRAFAL